MLETSQPSLRQEQHPLIHRLAERIINYWHKYLDLSNYSLPDGLGYVEGKLEGERLRIENRCYQTPQFRKMHLELAKVGKNLDILHCVMFPHPSYPLPVFGCDIVASKNGVSAAIADLSPTSPEKTLSSDYVSSLSKLPKTKFSEVRDLPSWADIFSDFCLFVRPHDAEEEQHFLDLASSYLRIHCQQANKASVLSARQQQLYLDRQQYYCIKQRQNDKTRRVLEKAFGSEWADNYMNSVLFDVPDLGSNSALKQDAISIVKDTPAQKVISEADTSSADSLERRASPEAAVCDTATHEASGRHHVFLANEQTTL